MLSTQLSLCPLKNISGSGKLNFLNESCIRDVFCVFGKSLLFISQFDRVLMNDCNLVIKFTKFLSLIPKTASSANNDMKSHRILSKSLINRMNRIGPSIEP